MAPAGLLAGALFAGEFVLVAEGLRHTTASHMAVFLYTSPVFTALADPAGTTVSSRPGGGRSARASIRAPMYAGAHGHAPMRLILSRKGLDSSSGGCASPMLPDGRLLSLPIPSTSGRVRYRDLSCDGVDVAELVHDLTGGALGADDAAHLDPDIQRAFVPRPPGWRPAFGQVDTAQIHLANQGVVPGDLFLFFGWFREVERGSARWRFRRGAPDLHVLFGWLQVDEALDVAGGREDALRRHPWLESHPHLWSSAVPNVVYVSTERLRIPELEPGALSGAGVFPRFSSELVLTKSGQRLRSVWRLPACFSPCEARTPLSYHEAPRRWTVDADGVELRTVGRGQEFVLDLDPYPDVARWAVSILARHGV